MNKLSIVWVWVFISIISGACHQAQEKPDNRPKQQISPLPITRQTRTTPTNYTDTLYILDEFASQPFLLDSISVVGLKQLLNTKQEIKKPVANKFTEKQIDTIVTIRKGQSYVQLYAVNSEENKCFYKEAIIRDPLPVFNQPLQIGQNKQQVKKAIQSLSGHGQLPDIIQISNSEGTDYVYLVFRNDTLTIFKYLPYLD